MLLPDTQVMIAQERIAERLRQSERRQQAEEAEARRDEQAAPEERVRGGWLRQLFLGKAGA